MREPGRSQTNHEKTDITLDHVGFMRLCDVATGKHFLDQQVCDLTVRMNPPACVCLDDSNDTEPEGNRPH